VEMGLLITKSFTARGDGGPYGDGTLVDVNAVKLKKMQAFPLPQYHTYMPFWCAAKKEG